MLQSVDSAFRFVYVDECQISLCGQRRGRWFKRRVPAWTAAVHLVHIGATQSHRLVDFHWFQTLSTRNSECKIRVALFNVNIMRNVFPQQIYDGTYRNSRLLLSHSKDSKPSSVRSTSNNLFIQIIRERPHPRDRINARPMNFTAVYASVILSDLLQYFKINSTLNSY